MVIAAVPFTSMGIGFTIFIVSQADNAALPYGMIIFLASLYFSGFIIGLALMPITCRLIRRLIV